MSFHTFGFQVCRLSPNCLDFITAASYLGIMDRVLAQSATLPGLVPGKRQSQLKGSRKQRRSVKMMSSAVMHGPRISSFAGLRTVNSLDTMLRPVHDFHSIVSMSIASSSRRSRATRGVPKAM